MNLVASPARRLLGTAVFAIFALLFAGTVSAGKVPQRAEDVQPLSVGDSAPLFEARTVSDVPYAFDPSTGDTLLIFYRGGWCPYCNRHLKDLRTVVPKLRAAGINVLFLSADKPARLADSLSEQELDYELISDASMAAARAFGVAFQVDDETVEKYKGFGIDLEEASGYDHHQLPVPAVYLVDQSGVIQFAHTNPDYTVRLAPDDILAVAGLSGD